MRQKITEENRTGEFSVSRTSELSDKCQALSFLKVTSTAPLHRRTGERGHHGEASPARHMAPA